MDLYDPHDPYAPPSPFRERFSEDPYQGEIATVDASLAALERGLRERLGEDTLYCVVGDHGESLGEHGEDTHGYFLYEGTVRVPLLIAGPGVAAGHVVETPVGTADLFPTILQSLGLRVPGGLDGEALDLRSLNVPARRIYLETLLPSANYGFARLFAAVDGRWKLVAAPRPELYDLLQDPAEGHDLSREETERLNELAAWISRLAPSTPVPSPAVDPRLLSLGYVGLLPSAPQPGGPLDPKDGLPVYHDFQAASRALEEGNARIAMPLLDRLLARADVPAVRFKRAVAYRFLADWPAATEELDRVARTMPDFPGIELERTLIGVGRNDWTAVRAHSTAHLRSVPDDLQGLLFRGAASEFLGDRAAAEADYRRALATAPGVRNASLRLAALLVREGRISEARATLEEHLRLHPDDARAGLLGSLEREGPRRPSFFPSEGSLPDDPHLHVVTARRLELQ
jgi:tetratricopeptide (TPR) repeat protein